MIVAIIWKPVFGLDELTKGKKNLKFFSLAQAGTVMLVPFHLLACYVRCFEGNNRRNYGGL